MWLKSVLFRHHFFENTHKIIQCGNPGKRRNYINDICHLSNLYDLVLFADDTNRFFLHNDIQTLTHIVNSEMLGLSDWFKANKLSLNVKKSNYVIFKPKQRG